MAEERIDVIVEAKLVGGKQTTDGIKEIDDATKDATASSEELQSVTDETSRALEGEGKSAKKGAQGIKEGGKEADKASSFFKKLGMSLKRIFLYRTIRKVLSEIGQAAREGVSNLYDYSAAIGGIDSFKAKASLDSLATSALYVKNSIAAALAPAIQMIVPWVDSLADVFARAANAVAQLLGALGGSNTYTQAIKVPKEMKKGFAGATAAAKELRRTLLGFDEVNRLDMETPSGGGGGGYSADAGEMFSDPIPIAEKFKRIAKILKRIAPIVAAIGGAFAAWKIGSGIYNALKAIGALNPTVLKVAAAVGLVVLAIDQLYSSIKKINDGNFSFGTIIQGLSGIGAGAVAIGILFGGLPALIAGAIGLIIYDIKLWREAIKSGAISLDGLKTAISYTFNFAKDTILGWVNTTRNKIEEWKNSILSKLGSLVAGFRSHFSGIASFLDTFLINPLIKVLTVIDKIRGTNWASILKSIQNYSVTITSNPTKYSPTGKMVQGFASGGFISSGELFIARENGIPEMVGQIGGQTAVANNDQIVTAIKQGVYEALVQSGGNHTTLYVDGKQLFDVVVDRNNAQVRQTGKSPILV